MADIDEWGDDGGFVVAIDGPAGAGKSTLARALARRIGLPYINTGLMYRAVAASALARGVAPEDGMGLAEIARDLRFALRGAGDVVELAIDGKRPDHDLASPEVEDVVSRTSSHPEVREVMRREQRRLGERGCVMEGRDIGSVVFPEANVKIFLSALPRERLRRRRRERRTGEPVTDEAALVRRDALDNETNPLRPAPGAVVLDTTRLGPRDVLARALQVVEAAGLKPAGP
jgi:cytidylate kinase